MRVIAITGGKGGTGKSTVATVLAREMSSKGRVLVVDADVDCPNDHLLLGIDREPLKDVRQRIPKWDLDKCTRCGLCGTVCRTNAIVSIKGKEPIFISSQCNGCGSCGYICPEDAISWDTKIIGKVFFGSGDGIDLLSGELNMNEPVSEAIVNSLNGTLDDMKEKYDLMIIDTAAGTHCPVIAALEKVDLVFAVTEPTPLGSHDLGVMLALLDKLGKETRIILNRSDIGDKEIIKGIAAEHGKRIDHEIAYSEEIAKKYSEGRLITDKTIKKIAEELA